MADTGEVKLPPMAHFGVVVKSLEKSSQYYTRVFGLGPWTFIDNNPTKEQMLVGEPFKLTVCMAEWGSTVVELLQPKEGKWALSEYLRKNGEGIHHTCYVVPDFQGVVSALEAQGAKMIAGSWYKNIRWCYLKLGSSELVIEILEQDKP